MSEAGCPPQNDLPNPMPQSEGPAPAPPAQGLQTDNQSPPVQPPLNESEPIYEVVLQDHEEHTYMCPDPPPPPTGLQPENQLNPMPQSEGPDLAPPAIEFQSVNQPPPVQPVMNSSAPINAVTYQIQPYKGYPVQSYFPNVIQTAGPEPVPLVVDLQPQNQPLPVQTVMNPFGQAPHQVQSFQNYPPNPIPQPAQHISAYPMEGYGAPGQIPPPAGLQPGSHPPPGHPVQNILPNPMPQSEGPAPAPPAIELQSVNQVFNQSDPSNPAPHQVQPYAAPAVPPPVLFFGVPPGLEYLTQIDQIVIHQKIECIKLFTGFDTNNQYEIKNSIEQEIYHAKEESDCFVRSIFGPAHGFKMHIKDNMGQEVIQMHRPMRCFQQELEVQAPPGVTIGYVKQEWSLLPKFTILGPNYEVLLTIQGPFLPFKCSGDLDFEVRGIIGEQSVGRITKQQSCLIKNCISDANNFCIQFPLDMDVKMKAVLLGACLLIDIMFFDKGGYLLLKLLKGS